MLIGPCFTPELTKLSNNTTISRILRQGTITGHKTINISPRVDIKYYPVTGGGVFIESVKWI